MKIVVTIAALNLEHGGPPRTVAALCRGLAHIGAKVELVTISEGREVSMGNTDGFACTVLPTQTDRYHPSSWKKDFYKTLHAFAVDRDVIIYDAGLWLPSNHFAARFAARARVPLVVSPRGMLSRRALTVAKWKKTLAWTLYQKRDLRGARGLHATSEAEAEDLRRVGLKQPVAVIPNGVDLPPIDNPQSAIRNYKTLLFLSRLHPIKGLLDLVEAWAKVRPIDWRAIIAGPDENNHASEVKQRITQLDIGDAFTFVGAADDSQKARLFDEADLFVLPSHSESFGLVIAEALAAGVPVITTTGTPWQRIETHTAGWWIPPNVEALATALRDATSRGADELQAMGARGRELVASNYSWESASAKMLEFFEWISRSSERPDFVR